MWRGIDYLLEIVEQQEHRGRSASANCRLCQSGRSLDSLTSSDWAMVDRTSSGSRTGARSMKTTPPGKSGVTRPAASIASRVLPTPPGPVSVIRRTARCVIRFVRSASWVRPIKAVGAAGRLVSNLSESSWRTDATPSWSRSSGRAAARRLSRCSSVSVSPSATMRRFRTGPRLSGRSRSLMVRALTPERSASSSWLRPAAIRKRRTSVASDDCSLTGTC